MIETWKDIKEFEGLYQINQNGQVQLWKYKIMET